MDEIREQEFIAYDRELDELRKIHHAQYEESYDWSNNELTEKLVEMDMAKLEALISHEKLSVEHNKYGADFMCDLLWERKFKYHRKPDFRMTDKKYQKFVQLNDAFMEAYKLAKAEAVEISKMLEKRKKNDTENPLLKKMDDAFYIDIIISPVFYDWDKLFFIREDCEWQMKHKKLADKYNFYEALEWAFKKDCLSKIECDQYKSFHFEQNEEEKDWFDKDPEGNLGSTNWAFEWIPSDSKYY